MRKNESGVCPKCGCEYLDYRCSEHGGNMVKYPYTCTNPECEFEGIEWYDLKFAGHWDADGNEL